MLKSSKIKIPFSAYTCSVPDRDTPASLLISNALASFSFVMISPLSSVRAARISSPKIRPLTTFSIFVRFLPDRRLLRFIGLPSLSTGTRQHGNEAIPAPYAASLFV